MFYKKGLVMDDDKVLVVLYQLIKEAEKDCSNSFDDPSKKIKKLWKNLLKIVDLNEFLLVDGRYYTDMKSFIKQLLFNLHTDSVGKIYIDINKYGLRQQLIAMIFNADVHFLFIIKVKNSIFLDLLNDSAILTKLKIDDRSGITSPLHYLFSDFDAEYDQYIYDIPVLTSRNRIKNFETLLWLGFRNCNVDSFIFQMESSVYRKNYLQKFIFLCVAFALINSDTEKHSMISKVYHSSFCLFGVQDIINQISNRGDLIQLIAAHMSMGTFKYLQPLLQYKAIISDVDRCVVSERWNDLEHRYQAARTEMRELIFKNPDIFPQLNQYKDKEVDKRIQQLLSINLSHLVIGLDFIEAVNGKKDREVAENIIYSGSLDDVKDIFARPYEKISKIKNLYKLIQLKGGLKVRINKMAVTLPIDIIDSIFKYIKPTDFENFLIAVHSSKDFRNLQDEAQSLLNNHKSKESSVQSCLSCIEIESCTQFIEEECCMTCSIS